MAESNRERYKRDWEEVERRSRGLPFAETHPLTVCFDARAQPLVQTGEERGRVLISISGHDGNA